MSDDTKRTAIATAYALKRQLQALVDQPDNGEGSPAYYALDLVDQVIGYIDDGEDDPLGEPEPVRPKLRVV